MTQFFYNLTPDVILKAVDAAGFEPTGHCLALGSLENRVFDLMLENGHHVVVKFYRPGRWSRATILEEHQFLLALRDAEIPVCAPAAFKDGSTLHETHELFFAVWPRTGGRSPDELNDNDVTLLGRLLARIHNVAASLPVHARPALTAERYLYEPVRFLEKDFLPDSFRARYRSAAEGIGRLYAEWSRDVQTQLIHGDCHLGNLLRGEGGFFFLDFDDCLIGPPVQDFWMMLPRGDEGAHQRSLFIDAYDQFRPFDRSTLRLIEPLRAMRYVHYAAWVARRWEDPAFPDAFPEFGTRDYWEKETTDLEEAYDEISSGLRPGRGVAPADDSRDSTDKRELTNKDFFWDMQ